jgi:Arc/MetJ-type ribon-helix-helix transcriptional regulator
VLTDASVGCVSMILSMTKAKIAVTIDRQLLAKVRQAVDEGIAPNVSAYIEGAVAARLSEDRDYFAMLDDMLAGSGGPLTDEERAEIDRELGWG